jgi:shikimate dehydrogenase
VITYGLIGFPLSHSWSVDYFTKKFETEQKKERQYCLFPLNSLADFHDLLQQYPDLSGLNVTIPYKEKIIDFLDELEDTAKEIGAVNTIQILNKGKKIHLKGYNTDAEGFLKSADFSDHSNALILGSGGAAKAVRYALKKLGIQSLIVSRSPFYPEVISYSDLDRYMIHENRLIINATPAGMTPDIDSFPPIPYHYLTARHFLYDLVYNPALTQFLQKGREYGAKTQNGLRMLQLQAELSFAIWNSL